MPSIELRLVTSTSRAWLTDQHYARLSRSQPTDTCASVSGGNTG